MSIGNPARRVIACAWLVALCVLVAAGTARAQCEQAKFLPSDYDPEALFGQDVAISGNVAIVGAPRDDEFGREAGAAYIFRYNGSAWIEEAKFVGSDTEPGNRFGRALAIEGDVALVGVHYNNPQGIPDAGAAYVFRYDGSHWVEEQKLVASDVYRFDYFGWSVDLSGDVAVIGAIGANPMGGESGAAYVFRYDGSQWVEEQKLVAFDGAGGDGFGYSVSLIGNDLIVGSRLDRYNGLSPGSAYWYQYDGTQWIIRAKIMPLDGGVWDYFGQAVQMDRQRCFIGARSDDGAPDTGSVYVFRLDDDGATQVAKLLADDGYGSDRFGKSLAVANGRLLVGSENDAVGERSGAVYVFGDDGDGWRQLDKIVPSDARPYDVFGVSVAADGDRAIAGAYGYGGAYVLDVVACVCGPDLDRNGALDSRDFVVFLNAYVTNDPAADYNHDGQINTDDFNDFLSDFVDGCP